MGVGLFSMTFLTSWFVNHRSDKEGERKRRIGRKKFRHGQFSLPEGEGDTGNE